MYRKKVGISHTNSIAYNAVFKGNLFFTIQIIKYIKNILFELFFNIFSL